MDARQPKLADSAVGAALLAGSANVIMQLARPPVGYGVVESRVESGNLFHHPMKRTRTTLTYLSVAFFGTDEERLAYRRAVDQVHARVRSTESSPVAYNAFDPDLQLWVAACLYRGVEDTTRVFLGGDPARFYPESAVLGTTLQVRPEQWPADRDSFERYWKSALDDVRIDDTIRRYLMNIVDLKFLPRIFSVLFGRFQRFVTTGFLPPEFRDQMRLAWSARRQRRFDALMAAIGAVSRRLPGPLRRFPFNFYLYDFRLRLRTGRPLI
jgi:uncharacterized protein (DUF2236 family)